MYLVPTKLEFGTISEDETRTRSVKIARYDGSPVKFQRIKSQSQALQVKEVVCGDEKDSFIELKIALNGSASEAENGLSPVVVVTEHPVYSEIEVPVVVKIAASHHGLISSVFIDRLSRGTFQDKPLADGIGPPPNIEKISYEGEGPITVKLITCRDRSTGNVKPIVRVWCRDEPTELRICRGTLVVLLTGKGKPIRIPLTVYLSE